MTILKHDPNDSVAIPQQTGSAAVRGNYLK